MELEELMNYQMTAEETAYMNKLFEQIYARFYDLHDNGEKVSYAPCKSYRELVDMFDNTLARFECKPLQSLCKYRNDIMTSDREAASFTKCFFYLWCAKQQDLPFTAEWSAYI